MSKTVSIALACEADILIRAARLVDIGEIAQAVKLLEQAHNEKPRSDKLLGVLND